MKALFTLGLSEAAERLARGEITSEALTASCIRRIAAVEPRVQAWEWLDDTRALRLARSVDERRRAVREGGNAGAVDIALLPERGSLSGIPIGVKDIIETAGIRTGMGSPIYGEYVPRRDAPLLDRLAASGAFVLGKTVATEFAFMVPGKTRNPWNPDHSPGGSSSGSAAAVASGMVPGAIGTQTTGSVIRPAAYCGVVGYKPDKGLVSTEGMLPFSTTLDQPGVFARSVADAGLLASWLTQADGVISRQITELRSAPSVIALNSPVWHKADPAMRQRFAADLAAVRAGGATVTERELPPAFDDGFRAHRTIMLYEAARASKVVRQHHGLHLSRFLREALEEGDGIADEDYRRALVLRERLIESLGEFLDDRHEAILTPPTTGEAPALESTGDPAFCTLWSLCGVPAITIPTGFGPQRLPLGLQIVGRAGESNHLLGVAAWCESRMGFKGMLARV
ncbi:MAG: amidase [Burkholderiales bacterium]|nr:amidase [Burkholderiales bacterium]